MECTEVRDLLSPMSDHEVTAEDLRCVEEHLGTCRDCAFQSTMIVGLKRLLGRWEGLHASETFRAAILDRVRREPPPSVFSRLRARHFAVIGALAGISVLVVVLGLAFSGRDESVRLVEPGLDARGDAGPPSTPTKPARADPVAQVVLEEPAIYIDRPGSLTSLGSAGDVLLPGQSIRCSKKGMAELALVAGFRARLGHGSYLAFGESGQSADLRAGDAMLRGPAAPGRARAFWISCGRTFVTLGESDLLLEIKRQQDGALRLLVAGGTVSVHLGVTGGMEEVRRRGGGLVLRAGETMVMNAEGSARASPRKAEPEELARLGRWGER